MSSEVRRGVCGEEGTGDRPHASSRTPWAANPRGGAESGSSAWGRPASSGSGVSAAAPAGPCGGSDARTACALAAPPRGAFSWLLPGRITGASTRSPPPLSGSADFPEHLPLPWSEMPPLDSLQSPRARLCVIRTVRTSTRRVRTHAHPVYAACLRGLPSSSPLHSWNSASEPWWESLRHGLRG